MNRQRMMNALCKMIGKKNVTRLQSQLKFMLNFRSDYLPAKAGGGTSKCKTYIFIVDGKTAHGGLSDRLRGCFSVYDYCKLHGYDFKIYWTYPDNITNYFLPNDVDWNIACNEMVYNKTVVDFRFFNTYTMLQDDPTSYADLLESSKSIVHVYSNLTMNEEGYKEDFAELFRLSPILLNEVQNHLKKIGGDYISCTFRFMGLLGDFKDRPDLYPPLNSEKEKDEYIRICISKLGELKEKHSQIRKILVTSDSATFLQYASKLDWVYIIPGTLTHMDTTDNRTGLSQLKSFLDFVLISKARESYTYAFGKMFRGSKFAKTAALIDGRDVVELG